jgi:hypothetical protein
MTPTSPSARERMAGAQKSSFSFLESGHASLLRGGPARPHDLHSTVFANGVSFREAPCRFDSFGQGCFPKIAAHEWDAKQTQ